ncbi:hypothetical protein VTL71DRAFT_463 [Oculimacula yallundae]|uniref:PH domain-containing protein n=1 Tax=Oculimacula yallundae TaxID=86028 RepID=A0ABR4D041_9HELO
MASDTDFQQISESKLPDSQIKHLAVNTNGWAMIDGTNGRETNETITARAPFTTLYSTVITNNNGKDDIVFRSSLELTRDELSPPTKGHRKYLIVGYALRREPQRTYLKKNRAYMKGKSGPVGNSKPSNVLRWDSSAPPILVVVDLSVKEEETLEYWALLWPKNGVCTPFSIKEENVFFRWEFRSFTKTKERSLAWRKNIMEAVKAIKLREETFSKNVSSRDFDAGHKPWDSEEPREVPRDCQSFADKNPAGGGRKEEFSSANNVAKDFAYRDPGISAPSRIEAAQSPFQPVKAGSSPLALQSYVPLTSAHAPATNMREESLELETLRTARELHKIARQSFKAEREKLLAETKTFTDKEEALKSWQAALNQEKDSFQQGLAFKASKLTEREEFMRTREHNVYERELRLQAREDAMKQEEGRAETTAQKLRRWEDALTRKGQEFVERESRYRDQRAMLEADEQILQGREIAIEEEQKVLDTKISDAFEFLSMFQQTRKRKGGPDGGVVGRDSKKQREGIGR